MRLSDTRQTRRQTQTNAFTHDTIYTVFSDKEIRFAYATETVDFTVGSRSWADIYSDGWTDYTNHFCFFAPRYTGAPYCNDERRPALRGNTGH